MAKIKQPRIGKPIIYIPNLHKYLLWTFQVTSAKDLQSPQNSRAHVFDIVGRKLYAVRERINYLLGRRSLNKYLRM